MASPMRLVGAVIVAGSVMGAQAPGGQGRVTGRVATAQAELLADATVTLARVNAQGVAFAARHTVSGPGGEFTFDGVPAGRYQVSAEKPGYTSRQLPPADANPMTNFFFMTGPRVDLGEGEQALGVEVLVHRVASIAGRIVRPDGTPLPGARVMVGLAAARSLLLLQTDTTSEWDGRYRIEGLPPGDYVVSTDPGIDPLTGGTPDRTLYPGVTEPEGAEVVTLLEGVPAEGIDIWLTPARRFRVSGRVFWPAGLAVERVAIEYGDPDRTHSGLWLLSDPGGLFTLTGVPPGTLVLLARGESDQGPLLGYASTQVTADGVEDIVLALDEPGEVRGRVVYDASLPPSTRADSIALRQTLIKVSPLYLVPEATVADDGQFALLGALGEYEVTVRGLPSGAGVLRILRNGRPLPGSRLRVGGRERVTDVQVIVGRP
jgi:hypothetical protein